MSVLLGLGLAGLGLAGSGIGTAVNVHENQKNRDFSHNEAELARLYDYKMDSTKYQRAVKDMEKAGINPAMAFGGGAGGISAPHSTAAHATGSSNIAANMINSAANLAAAFNYDKDKSNNVNLNQVTKATAYLQRNNMKSFDELYTDLDKVKI